MANALELRYAHYGKRASESVAAEEMDSKMVTLEVRLFQKWSCVPYILRRWAETQQTANNPENELKDSTKYRGETCYVDCDIRLVILRANSQYVVGETDAIKESLKGLSSEEISLISSDGTTWPHRALANAFWRGYIPFCLLILRASRSERTDKIFKAYNGDQPADNGLGCRSGYLQEKCGQ